MTVVAITDAPKATKQEKLDIYCQKLVDGWVEKRLALLLVMLRRMLRQTLKSTIGRIMGTSPPTSLSTLVVTPLLL